jgi:hypothetical protein
MVSNFSNPVSFSFGKQWSGKIDVHNNNPI